MSYYITMVPRCCALALLLGLASADDFRVAVIGSGVGGASASFFLSNASTVPSVIDVFERGPTVGGRAHTITVGGRRIDAGATAISSLNMYLNRFVALFNLTVADDADDDDGGDDATAGVGEIGIWDGQSLVFRASESGVSLPAKVAPFSSSRTTAAIYYSRDIPVTTSAQRSSRATASARSRRSLPSVRPLTASPACTRCRRTPATARCRPRSTPRGRCSARSALPISRRS